MATLSSPNFSQVGVQARRTQSGVFTFDLQQEIGDLTRHIQGMEKQVEKAVQRALRKTIRWVRTHSIKELGKELNIKQAAIKNRFRLETSTKKNEVKLWVGLLAVAAHDLGKVQQTAAGVRVGRHRFDGAFYKRIYESSESVYIRASRNKVFRHDAVRLNMKHNSNYDHSFMAENSGRFPVQVVGISIVDEAEKVLAKFENRVNTQFIKILNQELNYALNIEQT